jgi:hypothetical protein
MAPGSKLYKRAPLGGDYSITVISGALTTVAADGPVWSCRWTSETKACVVKSVCLHLDCTTAYTTAQPTSYGLYFARSYTAVDSGGTAATLTTNNGKLDTSYPTTAMADMRIGTTGVITAGTRTLDAQAIDVFSFATTALGAGGQEIARYGGADDIQQIILRSNEGLVLHNLVLMGAVGVVKLYVTLVWAEVPKLNV